MIRRWSCPLKAAHLSRRRQDCCCTRDECFVQCPGSRQGFRCREFPLYRSRVDLPPRPDGCGSSRAKPGRPWPEAPRALHPDSVLRWLRPAPLRLALEAAALGLPCTAASPEQHNSAGRQGKHGRSTPDPSYRHSYPALSFPCSRRRADKHSPNPRTGRFGVLASGAAALQFGRRSGLPC